MARRKFKDWEGENKKLTDFIYENNLENDFQQFSEYHFRIKGFMDVWPGSKKYYIYGTSGSLTYENISELKKQIESHEKIQHSDGA